MKLKNLIKVLRYDIKISLVKENSYKDVVGTYCKEEIEEKYLDLTVLWINIEHCTRISVRLKGLK